ncbi:MAG: hypothetical protein LAP40_19510 [Acidobacteriia bacterium]|nr:hypothetical protein [Terriglobia bacterium]
MLSITITVAPGRTAEGVMLAMSQDRMRIALQGSEDTMELRQIAGRWTTEDNQPVEFEALLTDCQTDQSWFADSAPRVAVAGRA